MNKVIEIGRLTKDPEIRYSQGANTTCVARYTLAVDRKFKQVVTQTKTDRKYIQQMLSLRNRNFAKASRSQTVSHSLHRAMIIYSCRYQTIWTIVPFRLIDCEVVIWDIHTEKDGLMEKWKKAL